MRPQFLILAGIAATAVVGMAVSSMPALTQCPVNAAYPGQKCAPQWQYFTCKNVECMRGAVRIGPLEAGSWRFVKNNAKLRPCIVGDSGDTCSTKGVKCGEYEYFLGTNCSVLLTRRNGYQSTCGD